MSKVAFLKKPWLQILPFVGALFLASTAHATIIHQAAIDGFSGAYFDLFAGYVSMDINGDSVDDVEFGFMEDNYYDFYGSLTIFEHHEAAEIYATTGSIVEPVSGGFYSLTPFAAGELIGPAGSHVYGGYAYEYSDLVTREYIPFLGDFVYGADSYFDTSFAPYDGPDFLGIHFMSAGGEMHYGWLQVEAYLVDESHAELAVIDYAWNDTPDEGIVAGAVPEPSTYAFGIGLIAMGFAWCKRRRNARV